MPQGSRIPKEYCNCGDDSRKTLTYSIAASTASPYDPCPYTTNNGPTVTFQPESTAAPSATPLVSCKQPHDRWFSLTDGFDFATQFCKKPDRFLRPRPGPGTFASAEIEYYNVDKDPMIRIYAYLDDTCREKAGVSMSVEDCHNALDSIVHDCKFSNSSNDGEPY